MRIPAEYQLRHDLLHPGSARLGIGGNDNIIVAKAEIVPDGGVEMMILEFALLDGPGNCLVHPLTLGVALMCVRCATGPPSQSLKAWTVKESATSSATSGTILLR